MFPYYLAIGMDYETYWNGDPRLVRAYREAHTLQCKMRNQEMWLQGLYNFQAFSTALSNLNFSDKPKPINKYLEKPLQIYEMTKEEKEQEAKIARQKVIDSLNRFKALWETKGSKNGE